jgi:hypothetical protein
MPDEKSFLLTERMGSIPSYMSITADDLKGLYESFWNIFKSVWSSMKLLDSTLMLNLRVVTASLKGDKKAIAEAFSIFEISRKKYDEETYKNLEYFRKAYSDPSLDNLGGFGPKVLAFAANPLLFVAAEKSNRINPDSERSSPPGAAVAGAAAVSTKRATSPRLDAALKFFGYEASSLNEAGIPGSPPAPDDIQNAKKLQDAAGEFVKQEALHAQEILKLVSGRPAAIKKIAESKSFDELIAALNAARSSGMKVSDAGIKKAQSDMEQGLLKQQKEKPDEFQQAVEKMRKQAPEIKETDDLKAMMQFTFGTTKSQIQQQLIDSYNDVVKASQEAMKLPLDVETEQNLQKTELGKSYLEVLRNFKNQLETGAAEVRKIK